MCHGWTEIQNIFCQWLTVLDDCIRKKMSKDHFLFFSLLMDWKMNRIACSIRMKLTPPLRCHQWESNQPQPHYLLYYSKVSHPVDICFSLSKQCLSRPGTQKSYLRRRVGRRSERSGFRVASGSALREGICVTSGSAQWCLAEEEERISKKVISVVRLEGTIRGGLGVLPQPS